MQWTLRSSFGSNIRIYIGSHDRKYGKTYRLEPSLDSLSCEPKVLGLSGCWVYMGNLYNESIHSMWSDEWHTRSSEIRNSNSGSKIIIFKRKKKLIAAYDDLLLYHIISYSKFLPLSSKWKPNVTITNPYRQMAFLIMSSGKDRSLSLLSLHVTPFIYKLTYLYPHPHSSDPFLQYGRIHQTHTMYQALCY